MQSILLRIVCWGLEMLMDPEEVQRCNEVLARQNATYPCIEMSHLNDIRERQKRRWKHSVTSVRDWYKSYGEITPPPSPPTISWASNGMGVPVTSSITLDRLDSNLFQDTTPPVSYYPSGNMKGVLRVDANINDQPNFQSLPTPSATPS